MVVLYAAAYVLGALWVLWYLYLIVIGLYRAKLQGRLTKAAMVLGSPAIITGLVLDWLINMTIATFRYKELPASPRELVTGRLTRYKNGPAGWKRDEAIRICAGLLDAFDPSPDGHCSEITTKPG